MFEEETGHTGVRELVKRACDFCRRRKIKCDGNMACMNCIKHNKGDCSYEKPILKRGPKGARNRACTLSDQHRPQIVSTINTNTAGLLFNTSSEQSRSSSPSIMKELGSLFSYNEMPSPFLKEHDLNPVSLTKRHSEIATPRFHPNDFEEEDEFANENLSHMMEKMNNINSNNSNSGSNKTMTSASSNTNDDVLYNLSEPVSVPKKTTGSYHMLVPPKEELQKLNNWPLTEYGIDFVKLVLYLGDLPHDKLNTAQIQSIVNYFHNFHCKVPILDINNLFYFLRCEHSDYVKHLLNDFLVLLKLTNINFIKTDQTLFECWLNSLNSFYPDDPMNPFALLLFVLDATIARLAVLLI
ncbi:hypothetical protein K502DRAFT_350980 [Neoconidiobolus thromboides FSU 785]|nr:hypothetical protein K502DRAFT_350980 [Neoconidiobolus thromboides FSU 785]